MNKKRNLTNLGLAGEGAQLTSEGCREQPAGDRRGQKGGRHKERLGRARSATVAEEELPTVPWQ